MEENCITDEAVNALPLASDGLTVSPPVIICENSNEPNGMDTSNCADTTTNMNANSLVANSGLSSDVCAVFQRNVPPDWEFLEIITEYLKYLLECEKSAPGDAMVSSDLNSLGELFSNYSHDFLLYIKLKTFYVFYKCNRDAINFRLAKLGTKLIIQNKALVYTSSKRKIEQVVGHSGKNWKNANLETTDVSDSVNTVHILNNTVDVNSPVNNVNCNVDNITHTINTVVNDSGSENVNNSSSVDANNTSDPEKTTCNMEVVKERDYEIFIEPVKDWPIKLQTLAQKGHVFKAVYNKRKLIHITTKNLNSFREAQHFFESNNIPVRTLDPNASKPAKFLFRGIPPDTPVRDIEDKIREVGLEPLKVAYLTNRATKQPMPLFLATIRASPFMDRIHKITSINFLSVEITKYNQRGVAQCYRCQAFGHSSLTCKLTPKCLICSLSHWTRDCKDPNRIKKCANCGGPHTANYQGCSAHPANTKNIKARIRVINKTANPDFNEAPVPKTNAWTSKTSLASKIDETPRHIQYYKGPPPNVTYDAPRVATKTTNEADDGQIAGPSQLNDVTKRLQQVKITKPAKKSDSKKSEKELSKKPSKEANASTTTNKQSDKDNSNSMTSTLAEIPQFFKIIREIKEAYNFVDLLQMLKDISAALNGPGDQMEKLLKVFEILCENLCKPDNITNSSPNNV